MRPFSSAPSANPSATLSDYIAALATPSIHKDEGLNQARKCGSHAFRVKNEGQVFKGGESLAADGEQHTDRAIGSAGPCEVHPRSRGGRAR